jgi:hypothetical protein
MFVGKAGTYSRGEVEMCFTWVGYWPYLQTLDVKGLSRTNVLAYYQKAVKSSITLAPVLKKHDTLVIYGFRSKLVCL